LSQAEFDALWTDLGSDDAAKAFDAICELIARAKGASRFWARCFPSAEPVDDKAIRRWVADLDSGDFARRSNATTELKRLGWRAEPALKKMLIGNPSIEARRRALELIARLREAERPSPSSLRFLRALEVLEHSNLPETRQTLQSLADGILGPRLTAEVRAALERTTGRQ
jgi:hypothetical protein